MMEKKPNVYWIDLFCGAGGTTTGIHLAKANAKVIACVNHDAMAIKSHKENHPDCLHLTEDVRDKKVVLILFNLVSKLRKEDPGCVINLWASLECTNYSKAKGGLPRDADSRTLAESLHYYIDMLQPDYVHIENVREFMAWGPLRIKEVTEKSIKGKYSALKWTIHKDTKKQIYHNVPESTKNGRDYVKWCNKIKSKGYSYDFRLLNAADYGAYTSRLRYFGQFAKNGMPISWPTATHVKELPKSEGLFPNELKKWKPVREVLDLEDEGVSIFDRKKPLSENTLKRIYAGLEKFVANGENEFTKVYNSGNDYQRVKSINEPIGSLTTQNSHAKVKCIFLNTYYGNGGTHSPEEPSPTVTTKDKVSKVDVNFFMNNYTNGGIHSSIDGPAPTVTGSPKSNLVTTQFIDQQYGQSKPSGLENPSGTVTANPKLNLVSAKPWIMDTNFGNIGSDIDGPNRTITASRHHHYIVTPTKWLVDTQYGNKGRSIDESAPTIIARQDKKPLYLIHSEQREYIGIVVFEDDSPMTIKIKEFMAAYQISDIKMRMLNIPELLRIQGFPEDYKLKGTKTDQKKFIGNAVVPIMAQALVECNYKALEKHFEMAA